MDTLSSSDGQECRRGLDFASAAVLLMKCMMKTNSFIMKSGYDGLGVSVMTAVPESGDCGRVLQLAHGMCGCKERYLPFMEYMTSHGVICVANDHRGHGGSVISRDDLGYMYDGGGEALVEDMVQVTGWIHDAFPGKPVYLLGHSMGSLAARVYVQKHDDLIDGLIVSGCPSWNPLSVAGYALTGLMDFFGGERARPEFLTRMTSGRYNRKFESEGENAWTCSDPRSRESFRDNPLCNFVFTVNGMHNLLGLMISTYRSSGWKMSNPGMKVIFLSGEDDPCMISEKKFHDAVKDMYRHGYHNISSAIYGGMRHEILNEKEKENVWNDIFIFVGT